MREFQTLLIIGHISREVKVMSEVPFGEFAFLNI